MVREPLPRGRRPSGRPARPSVIGCRVSDTATGMPPDSLHSPYP
jgi:hypothetical protein